MKYAILSVLIVLLANFAQASDDYQEDKTQCLDVAFAGRPSKERKIADEVWTYKGGTSLYQLGARSSAGFCNKIILLQIGLTIGVSLSDIVDSDVTPSAIMIGRDSYGTNSGSVWFNKFIIKATLADALLIASNSDIVTIDYPEDRITTKQSNALPVLKY